MNPVRKRPESQILILIGTILGRTGSRKPRNSTLQPRKVNLDRIEQANVDFSTRRCMSKVRNIISARCGRTCSLYFP